MLFLLKHINCFMFLVVLVWCSYFLALCVALFLSSNPRFVFMRVHNTKYSEAFCARAIAIFVYAIKAARLKRFQCLLHTQMTELLATFFFNYYFVVHLFVAFRCVVCFRNLTKKRNAFSSLFTITDYFTLRHNNKGFRMHFWVNIMFMLVYYYYNYYFVLNAF